MQAQPDDAMPQPAGGGLRVFDRLLTQPQSLLEEGGGGSSAPLWLLVGGLAGFAIYGAAAGCFQGGIQVLISAFKAPLIIVFGWRFLGRALRESGAGGGMFLWLALFALVSLQVATFVRPVLWRDPGQPLFERGKMFFLEHFGVVLEHDEEAAKAARAAAAPASAPATAPATAQPAR